MENILKTAVLIGWVYLLFSAIVSASISHIVTTRLLSKRKKEKSVTELKDDLIFYQRLLYDLPTYSWSFPIIRDKVNQLEFVLKNHIK